MNVFLCWSGTRSHDLAGKLAGWLPLWLGPQVTCFLSSSAIDKGSVWFDEITAQLRKADAALICLTPENLSAPWLHFEAGAVLDPHRGRRIYTYFLGREPREVRDPFNAFQVTVSSREDTRNLVRSLAKTAGVAEDLVDASFDRSWPEVESSLRDLEVARIDDLIPGFQQLFDRKTFNELLEDCGDQKWLDRYHGAYDTAHTLQEHAPLVARACKPFQVWLYGTLRSQVDGYLREIRESLLGERRFDVDDHDRVDFGQPKGFEPQAIAVGIAKRSERRCREIRHVVFLLANDQAGPVIAESLDFAKLRLSEFDDKKQLVHSKEHLDRSALGLSSDEELERCRQSVWDFDRIVYYLVREREPKAPATMVRCVRQELEKLRAEPREPSAMPLHYAVRALTAALERVQPGEVNGGDVERLVRDVGGFLRTAGFDDGGQIQDNLAEMRKLLTTASAAQP